MLCPANRWPGACVSDGEFEQAPLRLAVTETALLQEPLHGRRQSGRRLRTLHSGVKQTNFHSRAEDIRLSWVIVHYAGSTRDGSGYCCWVRTHTCQTPRLSARNSAISCLACIESTHMRALSSVRKLAFRLESAMQSGQ